MKISPKYRLVARNYMKGLWMAIGGSIVSSVAMIIQTGVFPTLQDYKKAVIVGLGMGLWYLGRKFLENSNGEVLKPEPPKQ